MTTRLSKIFQGPESLCYGCGACAQVCSKAAVVMEANEEGFDYPRKDESLCTDCGRCVDVCPASPDQNGKFVFPPSELVYAAWSRSKSLVMSSTSGGIFSEIAEWTISQGGVVYGCSWVGEPTVAAHVRISDLEGISRLRGSKYVQSEVGTTYAQTKSDLRNGIPVLYSGTPCQIAGLKAFLGKPYESLLLVDLVCHGVPSQKMLDAYRRSISGVPQSEVLDLKFRDKRPGGWRSYVSWIDSAKTKHVRAAGFEPYMFGFYKEFFSRESCYSCGFSRPERSGDITLSDYWGAENLHPELRTVRKHGLSMVMSNTMNGSKTIQAIWPKSHWVVSDPDHARASDHRLMRPGKRPAERSVVYELLDREGFDQLVRKYLRPRGLFLRRLVPEAVKNLIAEVKARIPR